MKQVGSKIATAAAMMAVLTVISRVAGFGRTLVFAGAVGSTDLGAIYQTANTIPNIIFEIVAGGALASMVVPLLAAPLAGEDEGEAGAIASALLTWTVIVLLALAGLLALGAGPIITLLGHHPDPSAAQVGARMLRVFAIQLPLYGVGIVLSGLLHAHRRFAWPVLAPLLSSLTVIAVYLLFAVVDAPGVSVAQVSAAGEWVLSVGTTVGVAVLTLCLVVPVRRLPLRLRPRWGLAPATRRRALGLAGAAVVTVVAQQLTLAYLIYLANADLAGGTFVLFTLAQTVFLLPWAVLAVPTATSAYPALARAAATGARAELDTTLSRTTRATVLLAGVGTAGLLALALPVGRLLAVITAGGPDPATIAAGIAGFAPGLFGYALFALLSRALYAAGRAGSAACATALGWAATALFALVFAGLSGAAPQARVPALALANSAGMSVLGAALLVAVAARLGSGALSGFARTALVAVGGAALGGVSGWALAGTLLGTTPGLLRVILTGMLAGVVALAGFTGVALVADRGDLRLILARFGRAVRERWGRR